MLEKPQLRALDGNSLQVTPNARKINQERDNVFCQGAQACINGTRLDIIRLLLQKCVYFYTKQ